MDDQTYRPTPEDEASLGRGSMGEVAHGPAPKQPTPLWKLLPPQFLLLNVIALICALAAWYAGWIVTLVLAVGLSIAVMVAGAKLGQKTMYLTGAIALFIGVFALLGIGESARIKAGGAAAGISVSEAVQYPDTVSFYFNGGKVLRQYTGHVLIITRRSRDGETRNDYWAAPVVGDDWKLGDPVSVWAVCSHYTCRGEWKKPHRAGVREPEISDGYRKAVAKAEGEYGLKSVKQPLLLRWIADPLAEAKNYEVAFWVSLVVFNIGWLVAMIWWRRSDNKREQEQVVSV